MEPISKKKLHNFIARHESAPEINPHGPDSPPRQVIVNAAGAVSAASPLGPKHDKRTLESAKIPLNISRPARFGNGTMKPPGTPRIKQSASQPQGGGGLREQRHGWESAPPVSLRADSEHDENHENHENHVNHAGLRERWEEQSNIQSLFSESELVPTRPASMYNGNDGDNEDTKSDILVDRPPPRRGRANHQSAGSIPFLARNRSQHRVPGGIAGFAVKNGMLNVGTMDPTNFNGSMITHAPGRNIPEPSNFREDPFATTSEDLSPQPERGTAFLHSSFPYRGNETAKGLTHIERAVVHQDAAKKLSPEKYDGATGVIHPQISKKQDRIHSISDQRPLVDHRQTIDPRTNVLQSIENHSETDSDDPESDDPPQEDEFRPRQLTPKAAKKKTVPNDATVVFNPQYPVPPPAKPQKSVVVQEEALQASPMSRFISQRSPSRKRGRDIDYDDADLQQMSFAELQNEPFDHDPTKKVAQSPAEPPADNLGDRLRFYSGRGEDVQAQFFTQMSVRDWEDSGDWFLEQFGDIVKKMKEARQAKRKTVEQYETEISNREDAVRRKKESIDRKLSNLRHDGEAMMKGKKLDD